MPLRTLPLVIFAVVVLLSGCDSASTAPEPEIVVESYQLAGAPPAPVRLLRTVDVDATFDPADAAVTDAVVTVERLNADGSPVRTIPYVPDPETAGRYLADAPNVTIQPGATYRLRAEVPGRGPVTSTTTVPGAFSIVEVANPDVIYQGPDQPSITVTRSDVPGRPVVFIFAVESLLDFENTPREDLIGELTPFYADAFDDEDDTLEDVRINPSPLLNEGNYDANPDGTLTIDLPWIGVAFYGPNRVSINVLDDNYYDFLRTKETQQNGRPGEIPNVIDHVEGGTGLFGSYARVLTDVDIRRP